MDCSAAARHVLQLAPHRCQLLLGAVGLGAGRVGGAPLLRQLLAERQAFRLGLA